MSAERLPLVTVLMTTFNGEEFVAQAVRSVLEQTLSDWEMLVVDDGSTDGTLDAVRQCAAGDVRIRLHPLAHNVGMAAALNAGLEIARGRYVARLDQDDVALPGRLEAQVALLEANPAIVACGTWVRLIGEAAGPVCWPADPAECRCELLFGPALVDPSMMFRAAPVLERGLRYRPEFELAEDYDFWLRLSDIGSVCNLPKFLLHYRMHSSQVSSTRAQEQAAVKARLHERVLADLGIVPSTAELALHMGMRGDAPLDRDFVAGTEHWLRKLLDANRRSGRYPEAALKRVVARYWLATCRRWSAGSAARAWRLVSSPLVLHVDRPLRRLLRRT